MSLTQTNPALQHFILTRFNLRIWNSTAPDDNWLIHRLDLFERFCYPSVLAQHNQNFSWLLLFDKTTPAKFRQRIAHYTQHPAIEIVFLDGFDLHAIIAAVTERVTATTTHVISTTLDNDDALSKQFVATIQTQFKRQQFALINVTNGMRYAAAKNKVYACSLVSNPFISLIEQVNPEQSLLTIATCLPHSTIPERFAYALTELDTPPLWLQVVHERNFELTGWFGRKQLPLTQLNERFQLAQVADDAAENMTLLRLQNMRAIIERALVNRVPDKIKLKMRIWLTRLRNKVKA